MQKIFEEYVDIKRQIKELTEKEADLKEALIGELVTDPEVGKDTPWGKFTVASRKTYSYSDKVEELSEKLKLAKHKEEEKGIATIKTNSAYLVWTENK